VIVVVDYGMGNLASVQKAFQFIGAEAAISDDPAVARSAEALVLPGVGAISDAVAALKARGMDRAVRSFVEEDRPFLGICLGMQMLFEESEEGREGGRVRGLGLLPGVVRLLPPGPGLKIPHMGWSRLLPPGDRPAERPGEPPVRKADDPPGVVFGPGPVVYFVHSYYCECGDRSLVTARAIHGIPFDAAVRRGRLAATQFHPEKSGDAGLDMLRRFVASLPSRQRQEKGGIPCATT